MSDQSANLGKGPLYKALEKIILAGPVQELLKQEHATRKQRRKIWRDLFQQADKLNNEAVLKYVMTANYYEDYSAWVKEGDEQALYFLNKVIAGEVPIRNTSEELAREINKLFSTPASNEFVETVGTVITEPIFAIFEKYAGNDQKDPKEFARAFHGIMASITGGAGLIDTLAEKVSAGQVEGLGRMLQSVYWNLGLGFLGWQTLAPLLTAGLQPGLERYYQRLYRPQRFNAAQLQDLFAMGKISADDLVLGLKTLGWRDEDVTNLMQLSYRSLTQGDVWELLKQSAINKDEAILRLRKLGYDPADIPLLLKINADQYVTDAKETTKSTAVQAYREHLIPESELRSLLAKLEISAAEIDLIVAIENSKQVQESRSLSASQIKGAWTDNVLSDQEARHYLSLLRYTAEDIEVIIDSWKKEAVPEFRKVNRGTVIQAYIEGILNRSEAINKLVSIGFQNDDAVLEVDLAERRNPEKFGALPTTVSKVLTPGMLASLVVAGVIPFDKMQTKLVDLGYSEEDSTYLALAAQLRFQDKPEKLSRINVERAYAAQVLDRAEAEAKLLELDYDRENVAVILDTIEAENPIVFNPSSVTSVRIPSVSALVSAVRNGLISEVDYYARTSEIGYSRPDAEMYLALAVTNERKSTKELTAAQIVNAYGKNIFTRGEALERLTTMGYSDFDANVLIRMERETIQESDTWSSMLIKALTPYEAIISLLGDGYRVAEIQEAFAGLGDSMLVSLGSSRAEMNDIFVALGG